MEYLADGLAAALHLLLHLDDATRAAIAATLLSTGYAMTAAMLLGLPAGFALGYARFPGRRTLRLISDTLLAFPTVLIGLIVYVFITYRGPDGSGVWQSGPVCLGHRRGIHGPGISACWCTRCFCRLRCGRGRGFFFAGVVEARVWKPVIDSV